MPSLKLITFLLALVAVSLSPSSATFPKPCRLSQDNDQSLCRDLLNTTHTYGLLLETENSVEDNELRGFLEIAKTLNPPVPAECVDILLHLVCIGEVPPCGPDTGLPVLICGEHCTLYQQVIEAGLCEEIENVVVLLSNVQTFKDLVDAYSRFDCLDPTTYFFNSVPDPEPNLCTSIFSLDSERIFTSQLCELGVGSNCNHSTESCENCYSGTASQGILLKTLPAMVIVLVTATIFALVSLLVCYYCVHRKRKMKSRENSEMKRRVLKQNTSKESIMHSNATNEYKKSLEQRIQRSTIKSHISEQYTKIFRELTIPYSCLVIGEVIGQGAFGKVFEGKVFSFHHLKGKKVAIKTKSSADSNLDNFLSEGVVMKGFSHPNVLGLVGVVFDTPDGTPHLVLPFMENGNLKNFLKSKREKSSGVDHLPEDLKLSDLVKMCIDVAQGMEYLADKMFVHRDLAARNCMVDKDSQVKVGDFGLSRDIYTTDYYRISDKSAKLPVKWMPPETFNDGISNEKTDIWAFGVMCWEVFSLGRTPYPTVHNSEIFTFLSHGGRLEKPALCPKEIYDMMIQCWRQKPEERSNFVQTAQTLSEYWDEKYGYL